MSPVDKLILWVVSVVLFVGLAGLGVQYWVASRIF